MLKHYKKVLFMMLGLLISLAATEAHAKNWLSMDAKAMINIKSYDPATQTYLVTYLKYPAQGPLYASPEELARSVPALSLDRMRRSPSSVIDSQYQIDHDMQFLSPKEMALRKKRFSR